MHTQEEIKEIVDKVANGMELVLAHVNDSLAMLWGRACQLGSFSIKATNLPIVILRGYNSSLNSSQTQLEILDQVGNNDD